MPRLAFIEPMAATLVDRLPEGSDWLYEAKLDGYRAIAVKDGAGVRLFSRKGNDLTTIYRPVHDAVEKLRAASAIVDGEIVAFDEDGRPSFQALQHRAAKRVAIRFFAFDLLHLNGKDLLKQPLTVRKEALKKLIATSASASSSDSAIVFSEDLPGTSEQVLQAVSQVGLEGVVAKRRDSVYASGVRSRAWVKFKLQNRQEFVIGGYKPEGRNFQSIVVGYYDGKALRFAGRVRAGFSPAQRAVVFGVLKPLEISACPFADLPTGTTSHWGEGVTEEDMTKLKWVKPTVVAEIGFVEWTRDGHLRHSSFLGLRADKKAREVVRERAR